MERIRNLYLHIPFCTWVCKYCDFTAYPVLEGMIPAYLEALRGELRAAASRYPAGPMQTVFVGGGTPSLLQPGQVAQVLDDVRTCFGLVKDAEVTLEANPSNVTEAVASGWLESGVTRLSIGVQSLEPAALRFLERLHGAPQALEAIRAASAAGFTNINADLLYGVPGVSMAEWLDSLERVLAQSPTHLSAYELTVEPGTRLSQEVARGQVVMPDAETQLAQYWAASDRLRAGGFDHYEISNWSRPGYQCRHNLAGWEYRPYLGCGAGAHSMLRHSDGRTERLWNRKGLKAYMGQVGATGSAVEGREFLSAEQAKGEAAMIGIRLLHGTAAPAGFPAQRRQLARLGLVQEDAGLTRLTPRGIELANQVGARFLQPGDEQPAAAS